MAHNAAFDLGFVKKNLERFPTLTLTSPCIDTLQLSKQLFSYETGHSLDAIVKRFGIRMTEKRHRSIGDCNLTAKIFSEFLNILKRRTGATLHDIRNCILKPPKAMLKHSQESLTLL